MAILHRATISPTKAELIAHWAPTRPWGPPAADPITLIGSFRFDDPDGRVGLETHLVTAGATLLQVPLTYRDEPLEGGEDALITQVEHSVLGTRWVYDGLGDPLFVVMLAAVAMTGQGEALGMARFDDRWYIAPSNVRIHGGGWTQDRVPVDGFELAVRRRRRTRAAERAVRAHRVPAPGARPSPGDRTHRELGRSGLRRGARRGPRTLELAPLPTGSAWIGSIEIPVASDLRVPTVIARGKDRVPADRALTALLVAVEEIEGERPSLPEGIPERRTQ